MPVNMMAIMAIMLLMLACMWSFERQTSSQLRQQVVYCRASCNLVTLPLAEDGFCTGYPGCHPPLPSMPHSQGTLPPLQQALRSLTSPITHLLDTAARKAIALALHAARAASTHLRRLSAYLPSSSDIAAAAASAAVRVFAPAQPMQPQQPLQFDGLALSSSSPQLSDQLFLDVLAPEPQPAAAVLANTTSTWDERPNVPAPAAVPGNTTCTWDERPYVPAPAPLQAAPACQAPSLPALLRCMPSPPISRTAPPQAASPGSCGLSACAGHVAVAPKATRVPPTAEPVSR